MHWKLKAAIQNVIGRLPAAVGNPIYYHLQTTFGGLRRLTPVSRLKAGVAVVRRLQKLGRSAESAAFLEIGTGHRLNLPLSLWLCGARQITTVDLNRYLQEQLVIDDIAWLRRHREQAKDLFAEVQPIESFEKRFERLVAGADSLSEILSLTNIRYWAPADASSLALDAGSIDFHISYTVLEHIPVVVLKRILQEGCRLLQPDGLFVHCIDFSDHFAHSDDSVSSINFLQFSENEWNRLAGNRYMFHNRLRVDEFQNLLRELNLKILALDVQVDSNAVSVLKGGFPLDERFRNKDWSINGATGAWLLASPCSSAQLPSGVSRLPLRVLSP